ncbi:MAG: hypothetical protein GY952_02195 [Rhodobacteraceae bacterium]|nr:hypothetical protein [Paracoccaceae bacterium]
MKSAALFIAATLVAGSAAQAEDTINRRDQCGKWEYIPASEQFGIPETALLFCEEEDRTWLSLRIECLADEKRMAVTYRPGYEFEPPALPSEVSEPAALPEIVLASAEVTAVTTEVSDSSEEVIEEVIFENPVITPDTAFPDSPREMVFFDFRSFGYTGVAYFLAETANWKFYEPEPLSPVFSRLMTGNYADISLMATGVAERLPLRGSRNALRLVVETCRLAKKAG